PKQERERHGKAACMGRAEKLLWIRPRHTSKPRPERISGATASAPHCHHALPVLEPAAPFRIRSSFHHNASSTQQEEPERHEENLRREGTTLLAKTSAT